MMIERKIKRSKVEVGVNSSSRCTAIMCVTATAKRMEMKQHVMGVLTMNAIGMNWS